MTVTYMTWITDSIFGEGPIIICVIKKLLGLMIGLKIGTV